MVISFDLNRLEHQEHSHGEWTHKGGILWRERKNGAKWFKRDSFNVIIIICGLITATDDNNVPLIYYVQLWARIGDDSQPSYVCTVRIWPMFIMKITIFDRNNLIVVIISFSVVFFSGQNCMIYNNMLCRLSRCCRLFEKPICFLTHIIIISICYLSNQDFVVVVVDSSVSCY